jgi:hypothetical protein
VTPTHKTVDANIQAMPFARLPDCCVPFAMRAV